MVHVIVMISLFWAAMAIYKFSFASLRVASFHQWPNVNPEKGDLRMNIYNFATETYLTYIIC